MPIVKTSAYTLRKQGEYYITIPSSTLEMIEEPMAIAVLVYLLSKTESWVVRPADIRKRFGIGDYTWRKAATELRHKGFMWTENVQDANGKILGRNLVVSASPNHNVDSQRHGGDHNVDQPQRGSPTPLSNDQLITNKDKDKEKTLSKERATKKKELLARFDRWYAHFPKKKNKPDALKAFTTLNPNDALVDQMIDDITLRKAKDSDWQDLTYICYPASYLRGSMWEDDLTPINTPEENKNLPRDDNALEPWATKHGFPRAKGGETYIQYRNRLRGLVEVRSTH